MFKLIKMFLLSEFGFANVLRQADIIDNAGSMANFRASVLSTSQLAVHGLRLISISVSIDDVALFDNGFESSDCKSSLPGYVKGCVRIGRLTFLQNCCIWQARRFF
jgi:hypothetical protein